ncbi:MAG: flagellar biosynthesis protein FlhA [Pseudomonadota bacterium]
MFKSVLQANRDLALVIGMVLILIVLFSPIPPVLLDLAIIMNFGLALTILLLTFYVKKPVDFSTFPSLLLIATLYRLAMNVAATRLILSGADAGEVIGSIGSFAVGGNFIVGLVVFLILVVVQYVVVTSGAQRVSEVAARFTLDSMPGQQMSIDADLNMGLIDQDEARDRRAGLEKEASFYGAMDGASKFVKGDAIAGIIILLIDILAGWAIGVAQMGMDWGEALQTFSLLTIGDGIATQLPALIIAVATGIIVTRSSADTELSTEVLNQLSSVPRVPIIVASILFVLMLLPGMPKWPIALIIGLTLFIGYRLRKRTKEDIEPDTEEPEVADDLTTLGAVNTLELAFGSKLGSAWRDRRTLILERIAGLRDTQERDLGLGFPNLKVVDGDRLAPFEYNIRIFGTPYANGELRPTQMLAIKGDKVTAELQGEDTKDPAFGLPAVWIDESETNTARQAGYTLVDPITALMTHLGDVLRREADTLLTRAKTKTLLDGVNDRQAGLVDELIPNILSISDVQKVLQNLLAEGISIANVDLIAEHLVDLARTEKDTGVLTELVRQRMSHAICHQLRDKHKDLAVLSLDPRIENEIQTNLAANQNPDRISVEPKLAEQLLRRLMTLANDMHRQGRSPVLLCGGEIRRQLRALTRRSIPKLSILSVNEIPMTIELKSFDVVRLETAK